MNKKICMGSQLRNASGQIQKTDVIDHVIYSINVGDLVLVSVTPTDGDPVYWSTGYYPNMTDLQSTGRYFPSRSGAVVVLILISLWLLRQVITC